jgi:hypothetical protein
MMNIQLHQNTPGPTEKYVTYSNFAATTNSFGQTPATSTKCFFQCDTEQQFSPGPVKSSKKLFFM